ncbi:wax ester/triacylglycerol synthase domain-containing protein [Nocardia camponoti]|uniref:O-acyltransferase WSD1-like N-terminal domain-containing protein n=1 Tax=Nocardia camponoti TaxID=1616106 RepID=A0A917QVI2_9NOCA|nr:wax ester/triacylglycerol synthase domain-containing protein [Nocardia camponoti]GGK69676.1 hypothetical protein GCM10011591_47270 [Nocardia camponoti]
MTRMSPRDATMWWLSGRTNNDIFALYAFAETESSTAQLREFVEERAALVGDLTIRVRPTRFDYPRWVPMSPGPNQFIAHEPGLSWLACRAAIEDLMGGESLDATRSPWELHVFRDVAEVPGSSAPTLLAVLRLSHALADGTRATKIARALFSRTDEVIHRPVVGTVDNLRKPQVGVVDNSSTFVDSCGQLCGDLVANIVGLLRFPAQIVRTFSRAREAERAKRRLLAATARGEVPPPAQTFPASVVNPSNLPVAQQIRFVTFSLREFKATGLPVTVLALTAISKALGDHFPDVTTLSAAVPMSTKGNARNSYRTLTVDLHLAEPDLTARAELIARELYERRRRAANVTFAQIDRVSEAVPALFARRDVANADLEAVPAELDGNVVVSSGNRGAADLRFLDAPVLFTGGFPALGTVMRLTHGVHGIGETIALSVRSDVGVVSDVDGYLEQLTRAVEDVVAAHT